jgi:penicillin-binding protein 2
MSRFAPDSPKRSSLGPLLLQSLIVALFCLFGLRLWYLQVYKGDYFAEKSLQNRTRRYSVYAPRGLVRDVHGTLLAINEPAYALAIVREDCRDIQKTLAAVSSWTSVPLGELRESFRRGRKRVKSFDPQIIIPDLTLDLVARIEAHSLYWPGVQIVSKPRRFYPEQGLLSHVLGYVAQANEKDLNEDDTLALGDSVGKQGLEKTLERTLRGRKGLREVEVDAAGRVLNANILRRPRAGNDLSLSIDLGLQKKISSVMGGEAGAVVVLDPFSGKLRALVSEPTYNENSFVRGISTAQWRELLSDPMHPLQNRAIQSVYPPGSVFKLVMAGCGLDRGGIDPADTAYCSGRYRLGRGVFRCWKRYGHGKVDLKKSLRESCDVYYYQLGEKLGVDTISPYARACGFGSPTGVDLPHEKGGLIPSREWKERRFGRRWQGGETLNMAIGQGYTLVTPLQVARFLGGLLNGGVLLKPSLLEDEDPEKQGDLPFSDRAREIVIKNMVATVEEPRGTARILRTEGVRVGGKTGTAQVVKLLEKYEKKETEEIPYKYRDHAWMAAFARQGGKAYVIVAMIEHGGHGGSDAGPVVKTAIDYLFRAGSDGK